MFCLYYFEQLTEVQTVDFFFILRNKLEIFYILNQNKELQLYDLVLETVPYNAEVSTN